MAGQEPHLILLGYGVNDTLQLTLESQRVLNRVGKVYVLHAPPNLKRYLKGLRVTCVDLSDRLQDRPPAETYLDVVDLLLKRTSEERPVVLLSPGNPHFLNVATRFLVQQARQRDLTVAVYPAVSQFDALVSYLGLDVSGFGLQMFDAQRLVERGQAPNPDVPLLVMQVSAFGLNGGPQNGATFRPLANYLRRYYPEEQPLTLVNIGLQNRGSNITVTLRDFDSLLPYLRSGSSVFIDRVQARA